MFTLYPFRLVDGVDLSRSFLTFQHSGEASFTKTKHEEKTNGGTLSVGTTQCGSGRITPASLAKARPSETTTQANLARTVAANLRATFDRVDVTSACGICTPCWKHALFYSPNRSSCASHATRSSVTPCARSSYPIYSDGYYAYTAGLGLKILLER